MSRDQAVALVSAGASGIGRTIADALWAQGYRVVVLDINWEFLRDYRTRYGEDTAIHCDVADPVAGTVVPKKLPIDIEYHHAVSLCP